MKKESPLVMDDLQEIIYLHLFPDSENSDNHDLVPFCRCEPVQKDLQELSDHHKIRMFVADDEALYIVCEHHMIH